MGRRKKKYLASDGNTVLLSEGDLAKGLEHLVLLGSLTIKFELGNALLLGQVEKTALFGELGLEAFTFTLLAQD